MHRITELTSSLLLGIFVLFFGWLKQQDTRTIFYDSYPPVMISNQSHKLITCFFVLKTCLHAHIEQGIIDCLNLIFAHHYIFDRLFTNHHWLIPSSFFCMMCHYKFHTFHIMIPVHRGGRTPFQLRFLPRAILALTFSPGIWTQIFINCFVEMSVVTNVLYK